MQGQGLEKRDVVLVQLPNWHEFVVLAVSCGDRWRCLRLLSNSMGIAGDGARVTSN